MYIVTDFLGFYSGGMCSGCLFINLLDMENQTLARQHEASSNDLGASEVNRHLPSMAPPAFQLQASGTPPVQRQSARKTSTYLKETGTTKFHKQMEIIDSTDPSTYVHLSRSAVNDGADEINIQGNPNAFNGKKDGNKRSNGDAVESLKTFDASNYTRANNAHLTLEGRYMDIMDGLSNETLWETDSVKAGPPVSDTYKNLNFGSKADHGGVAQSNRSYADFINDAAVNAHKKLPYDDGTKEAHGLISKTKKKTLKFAQQLVAKASLDQGDGDFVHYNGQEWF